LVRHELWITWEGSIKKQGFRYAQTLSHSPNGDRRSAFGGYENLKSLKDQNKTFHEGKTPEQKTQHPDSREKPAAKKIKF